MPILIHSSFEDTLARTHIGFVHAEGMKKCTETLVSKILTKDFLRFAHTYDIVHWCDHSGVVKLALYACFKRVKSTFQADFNDMKKCFRRLRLVTHCTVELTSLDRATA